MNGLNVYESRALKDDLMARLAIDFPASSFDEEAALLMRALVNGPYPQFGGVCTTRVIGFSSWYATAEDTATALLKNAQLSAIDVRCLLAAAGLAFARDPGSYQDTTPPTPCSPTLSESRPRACAPSARRATSQNGTRRHAKSLLALLTADEDAYVVDLRSYFGRGAPTP